MKFKAIHPKHGYTLKQLGDAVDAVLTKEQRDKAFKKFSKVSSEDKAPYSIWLFYGAMAISANPELSKTQSKSVEVIQYFSEKYLESGMMFFAPAEFDNKG